MSRSYRLPDDNRRALDLLEDEAIRLDRRGDTIRWDAKKLVRVHDGHDLPINPVFGTVRWLTDDPTGIRHIGMDTGSGDWTEESMPPLALPTLSTWSVYCTPYMSYTQIDVTGVTTDPDCQVKWLFDHPVHKWTSATPWSSPEQNTPHSEGTTAIAGRCGTTYEFLWRWKVPSMDLWQDDKEYITDIYIPNFGDGPAEYHSI